MGRDVEMTFDNLGIILDNVADIPDKVEMESVRALARVVRTALKDDIIPVTPMSPPDSGTSGNLRRSGKVRVERNNYKVDGIISFGNAEVNYASYVHEMPDSTNWTTPGTGNKYVEKPLRIHSTKYMKMIADWLRRSL